MDNAKALKTLEEIKSILDKLGVVFFLQYGTCLGIYRDNDFLPEDKDIDIGIFGNEKMTEVKDALLENGFKNRESWKPMFDYLTLIKGVQVDILFYTETKDNFQCLVKGRKPYLYFPKRFNKFENILFKQMNFNILFPVREYLEWCYGNWRDKNNKISAALNWTTK